MQKHKRNKENKRVREEILFLHDEIEMGKWLAQFDSDIEFFNECYPGYNDWYKFESLPEDVSLEVA